MERKGNSDKISFQYINISRIRRQCSLHLNREKINLTYIVSLECINDHYPFQDQITITMRDSIIRLLPATRLATQTAKIPFKIQLTPFPVSRQWLPSQEPGGKLQNMQSWWGGGGLSDFIQAQTVQSPRKGASLMKNSCQVHQHPGMCRSIIYI